MKKIAINGFGRIGRLFFKQILKEEGYKVIAINDLSNAKILAHLLKYDTAYGNFNGTIEVKENSILINGEEIKVFNKRNPEDLPWSDLEIDLVVESTGAFTLKDDAEKHIKSGAKKVLISAPSKDVEKSIVYSVNEKIITSNDKIISAASCTTNGLAPVLKILNDEFGIEKGFMNTIHAYTANQPIQDSPHKDLRRARAAASNIIPTSTGAASAIGKVIPELNNKIKGISMRVPIITGSVIDLVLEFKNQNISIEDINSTIKKNANDSLAFLEDPIVSSDIVGASHGSLFDSLLTEEIESDNKKLFKLIIWYDNEMSYVNQFVRTLKHFINL